MAFTELVFERFGVALESVSGTAITNPTHYLPFMGTLTPAEEVYRPEEARGIRAKYTRAKITKVWSEWECPAQGVDLYNLPVLLNMAVAANSSPSTPGGGTNSRLWAFARSQTSSTEKTGTMFFGDPNIQSFSAPYGVVDKLTISADGSGNDAVTCAISGRAQNMSKISAPTYPSQLIGPMVTPLESQLWIDTSSSIGTTAITGRVISSEFSVDGLRGDPKFLWAGAGSAKTYSGFGVSKTNATLKLVMEVPDMTQYDLMAAGTVCKVRVRHNGDLIEGSLYHYLQYDIYGILADPAWGSAFGTNRTLELTVTSQYDTTAANDWSISVQNDRASL